MTDPDLSDLLSKLSRDPRVQFEATDADRGANFQPPRILHLIPVDWKVAPSVLPSAVLAMRPSWDPVTGILRSVSVPALKAYVKTLPDFHYRQGARIHTFKWYGMSNIAETRPVVWALCVGHDFDVVAVTEYGEGLVEFLRFEEWCEEAFIPNGGMWADAFPLLRDVVGKVLLPGVSMGCKVLARDDLTLLASSTKAHYTPHPFYTSPQDCLSPQDYQAFLDWGRSSVVAETSKTPILPQDPDSVGAQQDQQRPPSHPCGINQGSGKGNP